jgi:hypothetical protein
MDFKTMVYDDAMTLYRMLEEKASMYDAASKKLKMKKEVIKEVLRERMIEEKLPSLGTDHGTLKPKDTEHIVMSNFEMYKTWLREGTMDDVLDIAADFNTPETLAVIRANYLASNKMNDRLGYLNQSCYDKNKAKEMHKNKDETLAPGLGIFTKHELSVTKAAKKSKK